MISDDRVVELEKQAEVAGSRVKELSSEKSILENEILEMKENTKSSQADLENHLIIEMNLRERVTAINKQLVQATDSNTSMSYRIAYLEVMATTDQDNAEELLSVNQALTSLITEIETLSEENKTHARENQANVVDLLKSKRALQERVADMEQRSKIDKIHAGKLSQFKDALESHITRVERKAQLIVSAMLTYR